MKRTRRRRVRVHVSPSPNLSRGVALPPQQSRRSHSKSNSNRRKRRRTTRVPSSLEAPTRRQSPSSSEAHAQRRDLLAERQRQLLYCLAMEGDSTMGGIGTQVRTRGRHRDEATPLKSQSPPPRSHKDTNVPPHATPICSVSRVYPTRHGLAQLLSHEPTPHSGSGEVSVVGSEVRDMPHTRWMTLSSPMTEPTPPRSVEAPVTRSRARAVAPEPTEASEEEEPQKTRPSRAFSTNLRLRPGARAAGLRAPRRRTHRVRAALDPTGTVTVPMVRRVIAHLKSQRIETFRTLLCEQLVQEMMADGDVPRRQVESGLALFVARQASQLT